MSFLDFFNDRIAILQSALDEMNKTESKTEIKTEVNDDVVKSAEGTNLKTSSNHSIVLRMDCREIPPYPEQCTRWG